MSKLPGILCAALLILLAAFSQARAGKADDTLNVAFSDEVETLDSYKATGRTALVVTRILYDCLLYKDLVTGSFKPELARSFTVIDDTTIDFVLREDVSFHDGSHMTADDVAYTLNLVSSKEYNARYQISVGWIDHVDKTGEYSVRLHMKAPFPEALEMLAGNLPIYPKAYYEKAGPQGMAVKPVGAGPYQLVEMTPGTRFVLRRFDGYYKESPRGRPAIANLMIRVLPELNTQYAELINGQLDWIWRVPPDDARNLAKQARVKIEPGEIMRYAYMAINPHYRDGKSPLADVRVRRAINQAINKPGILRALVGGASKLINGPCNPIQFGCATDVITYKYDPAAAKALLAEAGYADGFTLELMATAMPHDQTEAIAANLAKIGIKATVNEQQPAAALSAWRGGKVPLYLANWGSYGIADVGLSVGYFFDGGGDDFVRNPEVTAAVKIANSTMAEKVRRENYAKAIGIVADQAYMVPLWTYSVNCAQSRDLNLKLTYDEYVPFETATWN